MADNSTLPATGDVIAADEIGGVKFQRVKLVLGADGANDGDVASGNALPVQAAALPLPSGASTETTLAALNVIAAAVRSAVEAINGKTTAINTGAIGGTVALDSATLAALETINANTGGLTDAQLRAAAVPVSGPLTDAQLRAANVPITLAALTYPVSSNNSSTSQLAAGASFTGTIETIQNQQAAQISVVCDQAYTVQVQQFMDAGGTQPLPVDTFTRAAGQPFNENVTLPGDYFRLVVTNNGGSTTTTLKIGTTFGIMSTQPRALTNEGRFPVDAAPPAALLSSYNLAGVIAINTVLLTLDCSQHRSISVQCTSMGTTGVVTPEWSNDNATWVAATMFTAAGASATTFNAAGLWTLPVAARYLRLRLSTATTAGATALSVHRFNDGVQPWLATQPVSGTVSVTGYPTAAASADALANPTVTKVDATGLLFNGATWDRFRNNHNVAVEASSAKTTTGNGTTQTNFNAAGLFVWVNVTAVTGTTPTLTVRLQWSPDGGTTWLDLDTTNAQTASITGTGAFVLRVYPGIATAANAALNAPLPRTWRLAWTIGGTTPSFTFAAQASYIL